MRLRPGSLGMLGSASALVVLIAVLLFLDHPLSPLGVERLLQRRVAEHLAMDPRDLSFASVEMRGQTAVLTGVAPSVALRRAAEEVALAAAGAGGPWRGGVADVENRLTLSHQPRAGLGWEALRTAAGMRLRGEAPSAQIQAAVAQRAVLLLGDAAKLEDTTAIGFAAESAWEAAVLDGLHQLVRLDGGSLRVVGKRLFLLGVGDEVAAAKARQWGHESLPAGYVAYVDVAVRGEALASAFDASPAACTAALSSALSPPRALFSGEALADGALPALRGVAIVARRCANHVLVVDAPGANPPQRQARAQAVVQFLLGEGVRPDALRIGQASAAGLRMRATEQGERDKL